MAPKHRKVVAWAVYVLFIAMLAAAVEVVARGMVSRSTNPELQLVLRDLGRLDDQEGQRFVPDPVLGYRLAPGFRKESPDGKVTEHNALGFRGGPWQIEKAPDTLRIVCLGGSTTYGTGVSANSETYPAQLEAQLNGAVPGGWARVEVFNMGVGGYTSKEVLENLRHHALPLEPDVVLIQSAINDVAPRFYTDFDCSYRHFRRPWHDTNHPWAERAARYSSVAVLIGWSAGALQPQTLQARTQYPLPPDADTCMDNLRKNGPQCYRANLEAIVDEALSAGAQVWLLTQFYLEGAEPPDPEAQQLELAYRQGLAQHNAIIREVAAAKGVGLVDLERDTPPQPGYFTDPIHMTAAGNRVKAELVVDAMRDALPIPSGTAP